jgi:hypothetical protein
MHAETPQLARLYRCLFVSKMWHQTWGGGRQMAAVTDKSSDISSGE